MTTAHEDTALGGEEPRESCVGKKVGAGNQAASENMEVAQAVRLGQSENADTEMLSALNHYGSAKEQVEAIRRLRPELALLITLQTCLEALLFKAHEQSKDVVPKTGTTDYYVTNRSGGNQSIRQSAATVDRVLEYFCSAADIDHTKLDIKLVQDHPGIKGLDITRPKPFQTPKEANPAQCQWDFGA